MKYLFNFLLLLIAACSCLTLKSQTAITPKKIINPAFGPNGGDIYAESIATTNDGYTYTAGMFKNTVDFDFTADTFNLSSTYGYNMFIAKYDKQTHLIFAFKLSGLSGYDDIRAIATDKEDNIYVAGFFGETIDFDPGPGTATISTPNYYTDYLFIAKYDKNGNYIFAKPLVTDQDINNLPQINIIKADSNENIFIAGSGKPQDLDFDPGIGVAHPESHGKSDAFFAKYDASGNYIFSKAVGSNLNDNCDGIAFNKNNDIIIAGSFAGSVNDFDPNKGKVSLFFKGDYDAFIGIYDSSGNYKYAFSFGGVKGDYAADVVTDDDSNIIVAGSFFGNVDFAPDSSVVKRTSDGDNDNFIAKYTSTGKVIFVTTVHSDGDAFYRLILDSNDNIYIGGQFDRSVVFTPTDSLVCTSGYDGLLAKFNSKGVYIFSCQQITHKMFPSFVSVALRSNNQICINNNFDSIIYFNSKKITTQQFNYYIATYNTSTSNNTSVNVYGTYRKFNVESAVVKLAHDDQNNTYVAGTFQGIVDFDPGIKQYILTSSQDATSLEISQYRDDIFFTKYNANGQIIFANDIGGTAGQAPVSITIDNKHNIYLTAAFEGNIDVDPGNDSAILKRKHNTAIYDAYFIGKYDSLGNYIFAKPIYISGYIKSATIDKSHNIYIAGDFNGGYFDPANDTNIIRVGNNGEYLFFAKYNSNGKFLYLKSMGMKNKYQIGNDISINSEGNILICGQISGSQIDFDPGPETYYANAGVNSANFIAAYNSNGDFLFENNAQSLNSSSSSQAYVLKIDSKDNIISEGYLSGSIKLNSQSDSVITSNNGSLYFIKYSSTGIPLFVKTFSKLNQSQQLTPESLALDNANNIYIAGEFSGKIDFDPGFDTAYLVSQTSLHSDNNAYLAKYDSSGNYAYAYNFAPTDSFFSCQVYKMDLYINKTDEIVWGLNTTGSIDFDPGSDTLYYHPPFAGYSSYNRNFSFALVKFKQIQTVKPFTIYAISTQTDMDKSSQFNLNRYSKYLK